MSTYSFKNVAATLLATGGVAVPLGSTSGAAEEGVTIAMVEDKDTLTIGADGSAMHSLHAGNAAKITVRLLKTSPTNAALSAIYNLQRSSSALWGSNVLVVSDPVRGDVITATGVAFSKQPDLTFAKEGGMCSWEFLAGNIDQVLGIGVPDVNV